MTCGVVRDTPLYVTASTSRRGRTKEDVPRVEPDDIVFVADELLEACAECGDEAYS